MPSFISQIDAKEKLLIGSADDVPERRRSPDLMDGEGIKDGPSKFQLRDKTSEKLISKPTESMPSSSVAGSSKRLNNLK